MPAQATSPSGPATSTSCTAAPSGRERLLRAALKLSAQRRSIANIGLRELAREAGLHHTAIYRHFKSVDDVATTLVHTLSSQLRADLRRTRRAAVEDGQDMIRASTQRYFDYVLQHPQGVIFCAREVHGALPTLRQALQAMLDDFAMDSADDLAELTPELELPDRETVLVLTRLIAEHTLYAAMDYLEHPGQRAQIVNRATLFSEWLIAGASRPAAAPTPRSKPAG